MRFTTVFFTGYLGRTFHVGKIKGADVIYVKTGDGSVRLIVKF